MPVPQRGAPFGFPGTSGLPDSALFDGLLNDASRTGRNSTSGSNDDANEGLSADTEYRLHQNISISDAGLRNLGIAAIALGVAGFGLFWVPFAGLALAVVGLAASGAATVVGSSRRGAPLGLALAGAVIGVVATAFGGYSTYASLNQSDKSQLARVSNGRSTPGAPASGAASRGESGVKPQALAPALAPFDPDKFASGAYRAVQSSLAKEIAAASDQPHPKTGRPRLVFGGGENGLVISAAKPDGTPEASATDKRSHGAAREAPIEWAAAEKGESQGTGPWQVTVSKVVVGKVVTYPIGDLQTLINVTGEPYLIIWLKVKNIDAAGSAEFAGWMNPQADEAKMESLLVDDHGREHKPVRPFNKDEAIQKTTPPGKIFAGQTANDAIVFRVLTDDVDSMDLTLSGKAIGRDEDLHFRIPRSMIVHDNSNPLLGGADK
jgi:hypothetical protein